MAARWIKEYLTFTRKERLAVVALLAILAVVFSIPYFIGSKKKKPVINNEEINKQIQQLKKESFPEAKDANEEWHSPQPSFSSSKTSVSLFNFDPNTANTEEWQKLGVRDKTIRTIQNYLSKGGHFNKPDDLQKIYGLKKEEYEKLKPFIHIQQLQNNNAATNTKYPDKPYPEKSNPSYTPRKVQQVDIDTSDTTAWIALPGIGSKLAARIVNFREKLGGFHSVLQVAETYGVPDSTFQKIKPYLEAGNTAVKKININTADVNTLKVHPYIKWNIANAIIQYRQQHGDFKSVDDIKKIHIIDQDIYQKIAPYLTIE